MENVAVLIPCYNEELTIGQVIDDFKKNLPSATIYVYDNNSTDETASIAKAKGVIVRESPIQGKGAVVRQMFKEIDADIYLMVDGDATYPARYAPDMIQGVASGEYDMVLGDRLTGNYFDNNSRPFHGLGNKLVRHLVNKKFNGDLVDIMTGYRAFNNNIAKGFVPTYDGFEVETELSIFALTHDMKVGSSLIVYEDRPDGSKSKLHTISDGWKVLKCIRKADREYKAWKKQQKIATKERGTEDADE